MKNTLSRIEKIIKKLEKQAITIGGKDYHYAVVDIKELKLAYRQQILVLIEESLLDQLYRMEGVLGKYNCQHGGTKCNFQTNCHRLIRAEIDDIKTILDNYKKGVNTK